MVNLSLHFLPVLGNIRDNSAILPTFYDFSRSKQLSSRAELTDFLRNVERRAYKQAAYAVRDDHAALDIVQDAMMKLAEKYGDKPQNEFPMLFQRILQNTIRDYYRRQKVKNAFSSIFSAFTSKDQNEDYDPLESLSDSENPSTPDEPEESLQQQQTLHLIEQAVSNLPPRQREAFLLRYWEGMDISETAILMKCSEGSVKTHCSRATRALSTSLKAQGVSLS